MKELNEANFYGTINKDDLCIVDFWAPWCGPCRQIAPTLEEINEQGTKVYKVNVDENAELVSKLGIGSIPTIVYFKKGVEEERLTGAKPKDEIMRIISILSEGMLLNE